MCGNNDQVDTFFLRKLPDFIGRTAESDNWNKFDIRRNVLLDEFTEGAIGLLLCPAMVFFSAVNHMEEVECGRIQQPERGSIFHCGQGILRKIGGDQNFAKINQGASGASFECLPRGVPSAEECGERISLKTTEISSGNTGNSDLLFQNVGIILKPAKVY
jgi:hypothetical protein